MRIFNNQKSTKSLYSFPNWQHGKNMLKGSHHVLAQSYLKICLSCLYELKTDSIELTSETIM